MGLWYIPSLAHWTAGSRRKVAAGVHEMEYAIEPMCFHEKQYIELGIYNMVIVMAVLISSKERSSFDVLYVVNVGFDGLRVFRLSTGMSSSFNLNCYY